ncbi:flagellar biosynthetic protein FliO [Rhizobium sp. BK251]|uniref:flagellar biosynthetic protein FliO n=1 Tax=Rhizobium sp. BK251 TaxID=2512125 RepID=UPI001045E510|nr:flagellar biosynthetic protein FliO [Rhizobium sp. BK251]TCL73524.1 flagellar biosynthesis protein FliO [Rhizobium sp. BK251]
MLDELVAAYGSRLFIAAGGVGIALLCLIAVLWILRSRAPSPFVRGGKNRQPRLQVLDAAAVDARRRLVLLRRDDVEHLIMIGGPTDIVIESRISTAEPTASDALRAPAAPEMSVVPVARAEAPAPPRPAPVARPSEPDETFVASAPIEPIRDRPQPVVAPVAVSAPETPVRPVAPAVREPVQARAPERPVAVEAQASQAAEVLEVARQRVLPPQPERPLQTAQPPRSPEPATPQTPPVIAERVPPVAPAPQPKELGNDFQRVLEAEMSSNLTAERILPGAAPASRPAQPGQMQRRDPEMAPMTGSDAALQKEVARIFGEMSVNRDK